MKKSIIIVTKIHKVMRYRYRQGEPLRQRETPRDEGEWTPTDKQMVSNVLTASSQRCNATPADTDAVFF